MTDWLTRLPQPIGYRTLADELLAAIRRGEMTPGTLLPSIRSLAKQLAINPTTVARAYKQLEQRGAIESKPGQGSKIRGGADLARVIDPSGTEPYNMSLIQPQLEVADALLADALASWGRGLSAQQLGYPAQPLTPHQQQIMLHWLAWLGITPGVGHTLLPIHGAQQGLQALLLALSQPGDAIAAEALCYPGLQALCQSLGRRLVGLPMDEDGLLPEALDEYCRHGDLRLLFVNASCQNPTTAVMPLRRRQALLQVVRRHHIMLVDDDIYGFTTRDRVPPLYALAPEHCIYLTSFSKCLLPGLRCGLLLLPDEAATAVAQVIRHQIWMPDPLGLDLTCHLLNSGLAYQLVEAQLKEIQARQHLLYQALAQYDYRHQLRSLHGWLTLPPHWNADDFALAAETAGVRVSAARFFACPNHVAPQAVRLALLAISDRAGLIEAANRLTQLLATHPPIRDRAMG